VDEENTDWEKCVVCQQDTGKVLKCPAGSKHSIDGAGYKTLAENLLAFKKIDCLPSKMLPYNVTRPNGMTAVDCSIIKPSCNRQKMKVLL